MLRLWAFKRYIMIFFNRLCVVFICNLKMRRKVDENRYMNHCMLRINYQELEYCFYSELVTSQFTIGDAILCVTRELVTQVTTWGDHTRCDPVTSHVNLWGKWPHEMWRHRWPHEIWRHRWPREMWRHRWPHEIRSLLLLAVDSHTVVNADVQVCLIMPTLFLAYVKEKVKTFIARSTHPSRKSTTTICGVNYQLLAVMLLK